MKIEILNNENIYEFILPTKVDGNFWIFDDINQDTKLLNVEAINGTWHMRCAEDVKFVTNQLLLQKIEIKQDNIYQIEVNGNTRYICTSNLKDDSIKNYSIDKTEETITIGSDETCDICYKNNLILPNHCQLTFNNGTWKLNATENTTIYINKIKMTTSEKVLSPGSLIYIFGLKILVLNNLIQINNFNNSIKINYTKFKMINFENKIINKEAFKEEIIDKKLYNDFDYFFKAPRLRRFIETYELQIDPPPGKQEDQEMPVLFIIGPMLTTGMTSAVSLANAILRISNGEATFKDQWTTIVVGVAMLVTTLLWPNLTKRWQKKQKIKKENLRQKKYSEYIAEKRKCIQDEYMRQKQILIENLSTLDTCHNIIANREIQLWERKITQKDFLTIRTGIGNLPLDIQINYSESDFVFEEDNLKEEVSKLLNENKTLIDVPIGYSLLDNPLTALMGPINQRKNFFDNIILQLITFHSYDDLKIVVLTNERNSHNYEYLKILPHCFSNDKQIRFFATNNEEIKEVTNYLLKTYIDRRNALAQNNTGNTIDLKNCQPYYLIITDTFEKIRKNDFISIITEEEINVGFSLLILENRLSKLPSNCNNFINLTEKESVILQNNQDSYKQIKFANEIKDNYNMYNLCSKLANIPIEFADDVKALPNAITFLEMYDVGKVEQLNSLNRWRLNNPVKTLRAEIGVNEIGDKVYLDLHEKFHGPHGLVAGMTGSGKSEFIVTYVLSMAVNYSPNEVAFVLIDYKGGGLAGAFDNKGNGLRLPHLAGTITNLDKAEMNRSLASIDSELRRRQSMFNDARNKLGESTIDIYKYQQFFREGKLDEPIPHLIIICDEFAELKTQQPDFMENLISAARIGRSLGVHLILATQKPSGVVDAQIWSNTKFRVCLKVQDKSDSNEMLKRPDAAELKQVGRFYLQVGYNEMFLLGQSGYAGAKYFPSDSTKKEVDKSLNVIDNIGTVIASISNEEGQKKLVCDGEQLAKTLEYICNIAKKENIYSRKLWLNAIPHKIYINELYKKYNLTTKPFEITAVIGEYDNPGNQLQDIFTIDLTNEGNSIIYGINGSDKEMVLNSIIYSVCATHTTDEVNFYLIDYGSESLRLFNDVAQIGDMVFIGEDDKLSNLFKLIDEEINKRKKLFVPYSGKYTTYINNSGETLPLIVVMLNDFDTFIETNPNYDDLILQYSRDGQRYGIVFILTVNSLSVIRRRVKQNFQNEICLQMNSLDDYAVILGKVKGFVISEIPGRGLMKKDNVYEFQTSLICNEDETIEKIKKFTTKQQEMGYKKAKRIPILPDIVTSEMLQQEIESLKKFPIGIKKNTLETAFYDFQNNISTIITANEIIKTIPFISSILELFKQQEKINLVAIDIEKIFEDKQELFNHYYNNNCNEIITKLNEYAKQQLTNQSNETIICLLTGLEKFNTKLDTQILEEFFKNSAKCENIKFLIVGEGRDIKKLEFELWFRPIANNNDGIWIGNGIIDQNTIRISSITKEMKTIINHSYGWIIKNNIATLAKLVTNQKIDNE